MYKTGRNVTEKRIDGIEQRIDELYKLQHHFIDALHIADMMVTAFRTWQSKANIETGQEFIDLVDEYEKLRGMHKYIGRE